MSSEFAIKVTGVGKNYHIYDKPHHRLLQMLQRGKHTYYRDFWAVKDVSFTIHKGETVGIIGRNGSGKSTLLQMICGTLTPTTGSIEVNGRVAALLELGAGFNPEFTGRENVYMNAAMLGLTRAQIDVRFEQIAAFADIGDFIEQPVKAYSSGMYVRLAFAVIAHVDADILVVDEALAVGDAFFTQKCMRFLREFMKTGTVLFVSHDTAAVIQLCSRAILLAQGEMIKVGTPKVVAENYLAKLYETQQDIAGITANENTDNGAAFGAGKAKICSVRIHDTNGELLPYVTGGETVMLSITCEIYQDITAPIIGFQLRDRLGQVIFADNTFLTYKNKPPCVKENTEVIATFEFEFPFLAPGDYSISPAIAEGTQEQHIQHHWIHDALIIKVQSQNQYFGLIGVPMQCISLDPIISTNLQSN